MGITLQIVSKTYCCIEHKDKNIFNEDLDEDSVDNEDDKQVIKSFNSFDTDMNKSITSQYYFLIEKRHYLKN